MAEFHEQVIVVQALAMAGVTFSGSLNGCKLTKGQAGKAKAAGMVAGDPDLVIWDTPPAHPDRKGMCVEMKVREKAPKTDRAMRWAGAEVHQRARLEVLERAGFLCVVAYGADDALEKIRAAGYPLPLMPRVAR